MHKIALLQELRKKLLKDNIYFVQIGASDGDTNDIAKHILNEKDTGIFIEPCEVSFNKLLLNKSKFIYCLFLNIAIIPENISKLLDINILSDDDLQQGSSLISELPSSHRKIKTKSVKTLPLKTFIEEYNITDIDMFFCDTEGMDHILVEKLLTIVQPKILVFESFHWLNNDKQFILSNNVQITIPSRDKIKNTLLHLKDLLLKNSIR